MKSQSAPLPQPNTDHDWAVVCASSPDVLVDTHAPYPGDTQEAAEAEVADALLRTDMAPAIHATPLDVRIALLAAGYRVVPLTTALAAQYAAVDPDDDDEALSAD